MDNDLSRELATIELPGDETSHILTRQLSSVVILIPILEVPEIVVQIDHIERRIVLESLYGLVMGINVDENVIWIRKSLTESIVPVLVVIQNKNPHSCVLRFPIRAGRPGFRFQA
jgi:hypothetical protein